MENPSISALNGNEVTPGDAAISEFQQNLRGELIRPGDPSYDAARQVYNGMIDRRPAMIACCTDVADVVGAVNFGRDHRMLVAIRGGGHNAAGLGVADGALVIDLSCMNGVRVDPGARTVRVEGGATWGDVDHATHAFGMATPSGIISTTGVGGLTLGGGLGHLTRQHGLTIDNLLSADLVLADGQLVTASERENPDLFWAIRGGGGNFGVVTSFLFCLHPVHTVYGGPMLWSLDRAADAMRAYRDFILAAPESVNGFFMFQRVPPAPPFPEALHLKPMAGVVWCCTGLPEQAEASLRPIREAVPPAFEHIGPMPHPALQTAFDALYPPGQQWYWKADFVRELPDAAIAEHVKHGSQIPTPQSGMHLYPINGAAHHVEKNETAWSFRDANWAQVIVGVDPDPANNPRMIQWAREYWDALHPYAAGGAYVNFMMEEGEDRIKATYRDNYERLVQIKNKHDPGNLFRVNQNIRPSSNQR